MITLNYRDARPIYEQVCDGLRRLIVSGAIADGDKLPSVRALATQLAINPNTIQRAYNELESSGYCCSVPGKGCFAVHTYRAQDDARRLSLEQQLRELLQELRAMGVNDSMVHEDFMIGSADLAVTGVTASGERIPIFRDGGWAF